MRGTDVTCAERTGGSVPSDVIYDEHPVEERLERQTEAHVGRMRQVRVPGRDMRLCASFDLVSWSGTTMTEAPSTVGQTRYGAIVVADACFGAGSTCAPDPRAYLSTDGVTWSPMAHPPIYWGRAIADGPAGVLMIGQGTADGSATTIWRLDPAPTEEASPMASPAPASLEAACDGSTTEIPTPLVRTQPDGVHVTVTNTSGQPLDFSIDDATGLAIQGDSVPGLSGSYIYPFGPGNYRFTCNTSTTAFTVVDPDGLYVSSDLQCDTPASGTVGSTEYVEGARDPQGSLLDIARMELHGAAARRCRRASGLPAGSR